MADLKKYDEILEEINKLDSLEALENNNKQEANNE